MRLDELNPDAARTLATAVEVECSRCCDGRIRHTLIRLIVTRNGSYCWHCGRLLGPGSGSR